MVLKRFYKGLPQITSPSLTDFLSTQLKRGPSGQDVFAGSGLFLSLKQAASGRLEPHQEHFGLSTVGWRAQQ